MFITITYPIMKKQIFSKKAQGFKSLKLDHYSSSLMNNGGDGAVLEIFLPDRLTMLRTIDFPLNFNSRLCKNTREYI